MWARRLGIFGLYALAFVLNVVIMLGLTSFAR
jgi:hypothetical protein